MNHWIGITLVSVFYIIILLGIIYTDLRQRRILNIIAIPATLLALLIAYLRGQDYFISTLIGAGVGFFFFYGLFWLGRSMYGPGALGMGDVKLAMLLGAMFGLHQVFLTIALGLLLVGIAALVLLFSGSADRNSKLPFGAYLASAGIITLIWNIIYY